jgi:integral membrane protein (TIGR01906 family)
LALPIVLLNLNMRLVTGDWFVRWEYNRAGFPADPFGLSTSERIRLATACQDFLASNADISLLADLKLPNGDPAFNERELQHMSDVQAVYRGLTIAGAIGGAIWVIWAVTSIASGRWREKGTAALVKGSLFTLGLLAVVGGFMIISWGEFFTAFHRLFFEGNTWIFPNSDTLIRLFPIRFWIDVAAIIVGLLVVEAAALGIIGWATRHTKRGEDRPRSSS